MSFFLGEGNGNGLDAAQHEGIKFELLSVLFSFLPLLNLKELKFNCKILYIAE
jgi:hypothetical protein